MGKDLMALHSAIKSVRFACQINACLKFNSYSVVAVVTTHCIEDSL
jgi:hypothetical protein